MVFVGEVKEFTWYAAALQGGECRDALDGDDTEVVGAVDN